MPQEYRAQPATPRQRVWELTLEQAIAYVREFRSSAIAFVPYRRRGSVYGGALAVLSYNPLYCGNSEEDGQEEYYLHYSAGAFNEIVEGTARIDIATGELDCKIEGDDEGGVFHPEEIPDQLPDVVMQARFAKAPEAELNISIDSFTMVAALQRVEGVPEENIAHEIDILEFLRVRGYPVEP